MNSTCAATILDSGRFASLVQLARTWSGVLSAAILASADQPLTSQHTQLGGAFRSMAHRRRSETRGILVENTGFDCPPRFPFNMLRNLALSLCVEPFVLILDVDFVPIMPAGWVAPQASAEPEALVLPAFELLVRNPSLPTKPKLRQLVKARAALPFNAANGTREKWAPAHACTQPLHWFRATAPYTITHCSPFYEPYVLLPRAAAPPFDEAFAGRGFDKVSWVYETFARGVRFRVSPDAFVLHLPGVDHARSARRPCAHPARSPRAASMPAEDATALRRNPGESCARDFVARMRSVYGYAPKTQTHRHFRQVLEARRARGWTCNVRTDRPPPRPRMLLFRG
jgi:hypothetical protein